VSVVTPFAAQPTGIFAAHLIARNDNAVGYSTQQIGRHAVAMVHSENALTLTYDLFKDSGFLRRRQAPTATTMGDDFYLREKHVLKAIFKPPWSSQGIRSKLDQFPITPLSCNYKVCNKADSMLENSHEK